MTRERQISLQRVESFHHHVSPTCPHSISTPYSKVWSKKFEREQGSQKLAQKALWISYLRISGLGQNAAYSVVMAGQTKGLHFGPHVPHTTDAVPASRHKNIKGRVQFQGVDSTQMPMIVPDHLQKIAAAAQPRQTVMIMEIWSRPTANISGELLLDKIFSTF